MSIAPWRSAFKSIGDDWIKVVTGSIASVVISVAEIVPVGTKYPWLPWVTFIVLWSWTWAWAFVRSWNREHAIAASLKAELNEIYADVILAWLKEVCATTCITTAENVSDKLSLPMNAVVHGLKKLETNGLVKAKKPNAWEFTAIDSRHVVAGYKRIVRR